MAVVAVLGALLLLGCPGGNNNDRQTEDVDANVTLNAQNAAAAAVLDNLAFTLPTGVPAFGTDAAATTVTFANNGTDAAIASGGNTATTDVTFGSCIFTVVTSTFAAGHPLAAGQQVTVNPCTYNVQAADVEVNGNPADGTIVLVLNGRRSNPVTVEIEIAADGTLLVNGEDTGIDIDETGTTGSGS